MENVQVKGCAIRGLNQLGDWLEKLTLERTIFLKFFRR